MHRSYGFFAVLVAVLCCALPYLCHAQILFPDFSSTDGLSLVGDASHFEDKLRLTPALQWKASAAWYIDKQPLQDGFTSTFEFQITGRLGDADGLAFVVQNDSVSAVGNLGGYLGYGGYSPCSVALVPGIFDSLAIELDTHRNACWGEPASNHISLQTRGTLENSPSPEFWIGMTPIGEVADDIIHTMKIEYVPGNMKVYLDDMVNAVLTVALEITDILELDDGKAFVGITSGTGGGYQNLDILSWSHDNALPPEFCVDNDADEYGNPASPNCPYQELDCDDNASDDPPACSTCSCGQQECAPCARCINPGAEEVCNGTDDDCDGIIDNVDADLDGYIDEACGGDDCDDYNDQVNPGAPEGPCCQVTCFDKLDNDCDGLTDKFNDPDCSLLQCSIPPSPKALVYGPGAAMKSGAWAQLGLFLIPMAQILLLRRFLSRKK